MAGLPPDYDNQRWGGPKGVRIPQEVFPATMSVDKETDINVGGAGTTNTINLDPSQLRSSYYTVKNAGSGATTIQWPAVLPGLVFTVFNTSGQACTFKVIGATGVSVATAKRAILVHDNSLTTPDIARVTADT